jgi:hypothetical protein
LVEREDCDSLLQAMGAHSNEAVRERYAFVMQFLAAREETA